MMSLHELWWMFLPEGRKYDHVSPFSRLPQRVQNGLTALIMICVGLGWASHMGAVWPPPADKLKAAISVILLLGLWQLAMDRASRGIQNFMAVSSGVAGTPQVLATRILLWPVTEKVWKDAPAVGSRVDGLKAHGFEEAGTFTVDPLDGIAVCGLVHRDQRLSAVVCEQQVGGVWVEVTARYQDGTSFTATSNHNSPFSGHCKVVLSGADASAMMDRVTSERPIEARVEVAVESFAERFGKSYEENHSRPT